MTAFMALLAEMNYQATDRYKPKIIIIFYAKSRMFHFQTMECKLTIRCVCKQRVHGTIYSLYDNYAD